MSAAAIIIRSERVSALRNKADEAQDRDWMRGTTEEQSKRTIDIDADGDENVTATPGELNAPAMYNHR